jgi:uncharacterized protein YozE (UPF0346 family)
MMRHNLFHSDVLTCRESLNESKTLKTSDSVFDESYPAKWSRCGNKPSIFDFISLSEYIQMQCPFTWFQSVTDDIFSKLLGVMSSNEALKSITWVTQVFFQLGRDSQVKGQQTQHGVVVLPGGFELYTRSWILVGCLLQIAGGISQENECETAKLGLPIRCGLRTRDFST